MNSVSINAPVIGQAEQLSTFQPWFCAMVYIVYG